MKVVGVRNESGRIGEKKAKLLLKLGCDCRTLLQRRLPSLSVHRKMRKQLSSPDSHGRMLLHLQRPPEQESCEIGWVAVEKKDTASHRPALEGQKLIQRWFLAGRHLGQVAAELNSRR